MKRLLSTCFGIAAFVSLSAQCSVIEVPLSERANNSTVIAEGQVISQYSYWNTPHNMIYTAYTIDLYKVFKGNPTDQIEIIVEGGIVGMDKITVEPSLELTIGEYGMFTCTPVVRAKGLPANMSGRTQYEAYASMQGFVKYNAVNNTATDHFRTYSNIQSEIYPVCGTRYREIKTRSSNSGTQRNGGPSVMAGPDIQGLSHENITAGTTTVLTITGENFGATQGAGVVRFPNADDGGATMITPLASQYTFWDDFTIKVEVPQNAGTGFIEVDQGGTATSPFLLTIDYAHLNVDFDPGPGTIAYQTDHVDDNGSGGYTWRMNTAFAGNSSASASFLRAFDTWRCATGVQWTIGANTSINDAVSDGTNIICFDNTAPLSPGILGVCYSYWSGCASGPNIVWYVNELDIIFDEGSNISPLTWEFGPGLPSGSEYDFETVAVHELGHGHQLGHVISPGAIMHYAISNGSSNRSLGANDLAGGQFVQAKSVIGNLCGPGAMSTFSCAAPPVAAFTVNDADQCAGSTYNFTDLSTGSPTQFQWTFTGGTPSSSTLQNPTVIYNTPGVYDVTLTATNASGSDVETMTGYIFVRTNPTVGASANPSLTVCEGDQITLNGNGAVSFVWSGGVQNGVPFTPPMTDTYTVTGTAANGCTDQEVVNVTVNSGPTLNVTSNPSNGTVCSGGQATLTATGAQSYGWTGGITNGVPFTPVSTTTYTVTGVAANGCTAQASRQIIVSSCGGATVPCGTVITNKLQQKAATNVPGATMYRFRFYDNTTLALVGQVSQTSRILTFTSVPNILYGTTYRWTVAVNTGSGFGAESSIACTITFGTPSTTVPCGASYSKLNGYSAVPSVGGITGYRFSFYDNATSALVSQVTQTSNYIYFNTVPNLTFGTTYKWTVEVQYNNGSGNVFGPASPMNCTVTMNAPATTVPCNMTYNKQGGYTAVPAVSGAAGYRFTFYQSSVQVAQRAQTSNYIYFNQVSGIYNGQTYQWTVEVLYNNGSGNVYGPASAPCNISFSSSARLEGQPSEEQAPAFSFAMLMYPNPLADGVNPSVTITGADQKEATVVVMDLSGRTITTYALFVQGDSYTTELAGFPELVSGMYLMQVQIGDQVQTQRFVKE